MQTEEIAHNKEYQCAFRKRIKPRNTGSGNIAEVVYVIQTLS